MEWISGAIELISNFWLWNKENIIMAFMAGIAFAAGDWIVHEIRKTRK